MLRFCSFCVLYQQPLCYTIGSTNFALAWECNPVSLRFCACLFAHDCEYTRTHTWTHTGTDETRTRTQAEVVSLCLNSPHALPTTILCACVRDSRQFAAVRWIEFNTNTFPTHAHQSRPLFLSHSLSLSVFCTHAHTPIWHRCVRARCVRVFWLHLLTFWRSTQTDKSPIAQNEKKARALLPPFLYASSSCSSAVAAAVAASAVLPTTSRCRCCCYLCLCCR